MSGERQITFIYSPLYPSETSQLQKEDSKIKAKPYSDLLFKVLDKMPGYL
jgi:hypothetical protein